MENLKDTVQVNVRLQGEDAAKFRRYKDQQKIKADAAAGYKLLIERLEQVEAEAAAA